MQEYKPSITYLSATRYENNYGIVNDFTQLPHQSYSIAYILNGGADFISDYGTVTAAADDVVFIPLDTRYISRWHGVPASSFLSCYFNISSFCEPFWNKRFNIQKVSGLEKFRIEFERIADGKYSELYAVSVLYNMCFELSERLEYTEITGADERINAAAEYIRANTTEKIPISRLARIANMSVSHFQRCFKKETGLSPIEFKNEILISNAAQMLLDNRSLTIEAVSAEFGFESSIYFRRLFKAHTGKTPGEYRKSMSGSV